MNPIQMRWKSEALSHTTDLTVLAPEPDRFPPPWNTLYLLHGRSDDSSAWTRFTTLERQADAFPMLIVMPSGYLSYWRNPQGRTGVESAVVHELLPLIENTFHVRAQRSARALAGLSMGGYGALYLAHKYPHLFCAASAHSPAAIEDNRREWMDRIFDRFDASQSLFATIARCERELRPAVHIDIGDRDFLLEEARALHAFLEDERIAHQYAERQGGHDWNYWEKQLGQTLRFVHTVMTRETRAARNS